MTIINMISNIRSAAIAHINLTRIHIIVSTNIIATNSISVTVKTLQKKNRKQKQCKTKCIHYLILLILHL